MPNAPFPFRPSIDAPDVIPIAPTWLRNALTDYELTARAVERAATPAERVEYVNRKLAFLRLVTGHLVAAQERPRSVHRAD